MGAHSSLKVMTAFTLWIKEAHTTSRKRKLILFKEGRMPMYLGMFERRLVQNNGGSGFFFGDKVDQNFCSIASGYTTKGYSYEGWL